MPPKTQQVPMDLVDPLVFSRFHSLRKGIETFFTASVNQESTVTGFSTLTAFYHK